jgi:hypothetical protein
MANNSTNKTKRIETIEPQKDYQHMAFEELSPIE